MADHTPTLEAARSAEAIADEAARFLPVLWIASLQPEAKLDTKPGGMAMGTGAASAKPTASALLVLSSEPRLV